MPTRLSVSFLYAVSIMDQGFVLAHGWTSNCRLINTLLFSNSPDRSGDMFTVGTFSEGVSLTLLVHIYIKKNFLKLKCNFIHLTFAHTNIRIYNKQKLTHILLVAKEMQF